MFSRLEISISLTRGVECELTVDHRGQATRRSGVHQTGRPGAPELLAIDVTGRPRAAKRTHHSNMELAIGSLLIMFHQVAELRRAMAPPDIYIEPAVENFRGADFFKTREMFEAARPAKEQLKRALELRLRAVS